MATTRIPTSAAQRLRARSPIHPAVAALGVALAAAAALSACGSTPASGGASNASSSSASLSAPAASAPAAAETNLITLTDYKVDVPITMKPGTVKFTIGNSGAIEHELLVFKTDLDPSKLPYDVSLAKFDEKGAGVVSVSDGDNLAAGASQTRTVDLTTPGTYIFVCNLPSHYKQGMYTVVTVTP